MIDTRYQEDINVSYISAICASVEIDYERIYHDQDSIDGLFKKKIDTVNGWYLSECEVQLKSVYSKNEYKDNGESIIYKLKAKNYNDLCMTSIIPRILVLLVLPEDSNSWVNCSVDELIIKGKMYWTEFSGADTTSNKSTISVEISKSNILNSDAMLRILEKIAKEEWPCSIH